ncbi:hypothetical protein CFP56_018910 [Quercus suber]|uniref:CCHC-type domain-containing protein n=1 Tax=Quercus suber TaxID=58331 RepID=A0AAW0KHR6_QUESU
MQDLWYGTDDEPVDGQPVQESDKDDQSKMEVTHTTTKDVSCEEAWEIKITTDLKRKMAGPWQTSIILKLMGRQLGYRHALMDGPWFVGEQYLHVQAWEADFHPHVAKISNTAVWIHLEQRPIEYYHPDFLKHVGNKLGKLLKIDVVTSAASHGRFARLCVQFNIAYLLPKRVKIGAFWQDIVYENLPFLCFRCGHLGHREATCLEPSHDMNPKHPPDQEPHGETGCWTWRTIILHGKPSKQGGPARAGNSVSNKHVESLTNVLIRHRVSKGSALTAGSPRFEVARHGKNQFSLLPHDPNMDSMQE